MPRSVPDLAALGFVLRTYRKERSYTQEQMSFRTGMTTTLISDTENGKRNLSFQSIERILAALDVSWEDFGAALHRTVKQRHRSSG